MSIRPACPKIQLQFFCALISNAPLSNFEIVPASIEEPRVSTFLQQNWQILPHILERINTAPGIVSGTFGINALEARVVALREHVRISTKAILELIDCFEKQRIKYCLIKGTAAKYTVYANAEDRASIDIDIAIDSESVSAVENILAGCDYHQSKWDAKKRRFVFASNEEKASLRSNHYELGFIVRRQLCDDLNTTTKDSISAQLDFQPNPWHKSGQDSLAAYINIDVHTGLSLDIETTDILEESRNTLIDGLEVVVPSKHWMIFHLIYKIYWEGVHNYHKGAYQYLDLILLLERITKEEFEKVERLLSTYGLISAGLYVLRRLSSDLGISPTPAMASFLSDNQIAPNDIGPVEENNLGDMWPKLFGLRTL